MATAADFFEAGFLTVVFFVAADFRVADFLVAFFFVDCLVAIVSSPLCTEVRICPAIDVTSGNRTVSYLDCRGTSSAVWEIFPENKSASRSRTKHLIPPVVGR